jgi:uncharacterized protein YjbI with pentapeptide repeats
MGRIKELPSIKLGSTSSRQGLRKLSPDLISKARDRTATQVIRLGLTFFGAAAFCLLSLLSPDSALLSGSEKISVPFAGPVSFSGFMLLGPAVLIMLRVYLQSYIEHSDRLDRLARSMSIVRAPTLVPLRNPWMRFFSYLVFYMLLPVTMMLFAWKAAVFPAWGFVLFGVAVAVTASHAMLPFSRFSWRQKGFLSVTAAIIAGVVMLAFDVHRPFDLYRANLSGQSLAGEYLRHANLSGANLSSANLRGAELSYADLSNADLRGADLRDANVIVADLHLANLSDANLSGANLIADLSGANLSSANLIVADLHGANLSSANLSSANLSSADLRGANLRSANLSSANLSSADLRGAELSYARNLTQSQLDEACGNANTKLPEGLTLKPCSTD